MPDRAENLFALAWILGGRARTEAYLEGALAAALEHPEFYERLVAKLGWDVPPHAPQISTQRTVEDGRTDITLDWGNGSRMVLELKAGAPPSAGQIQQYLRPDTPVAAIAKHPKRIEIDPSHGRFFGVFTWYQIRAIDWPDSSLVVRQLHRLLDITEVAMPPITLPALTGILASWDAWNALDRWSNRAADAAVPIFRGAGLTCVRKEKKRQRIKVDTEHRRLAHWFWPPPWRADHFALFTGMFMGRPHAEVIGEGVPDMVLAVHVDPNSSLGKRLRSDTPFVDAIKGWKQRAGTALREYLPTDTEWEFLRVRESSLKIIHAADGGEALMHWAEAQAREWVDAGVVEHLVRLENETRKDTGEASEEAEDLGDSPSV